MTDTPDEVDIATNATLTSVGVRPEDRIFPEDVVGSEDNLSELMRMLNKLRYRQTSEGQILLVNPSTEMPEGEVTWVNVAYASHSGDLQVTLSISLHQTSIGRLYGS